MLDLKKTECRQNLESLAISILIILFILIFMVRPYMVKGPSMIPTLEEGERLLVCKSIYWIEPPGRGDIIVLKPPHDTRKYIKRVIGLPGDSIMIKDTKLYINGMAIKELYIKEKTLTNYDSIIVPEGTLFVMGDNRNCSLDSRSPEVGFIPFNKVAGKAVFIFWPVTRIGIIAKPHYGSGV
jgi:signal peptidase I